MSVLTAPEIELGRLAIERRLLTREQVRACADLRSAGNSEHLARLFVNQGYLDTSVARGLWSEIQSMSGGSRFGSGAGNGPGSNYGRPGSNAGGSNAGGSSYQRQYGPNGTHHAGGSNFGAGAPRQGPGNTQLAPPQYGGSRGAIHDTRPGSNDGSSRRPGPGGTHAVAGQAFGTPVGPPGTGGGVSDSAFAAAANKELPSNLAADDPIAYAMSVRQNADGTKETVFGPYDILGEIARGGMGIVYRARQRSLKRIVALKVMKEGENASEKQIRRFKRETEAAAKLQHPNIVAVHEVGCHEGFHYFTMDLIEGDPLDAIVKRKEKMPVNRVLEVVQETSQAIHYAHGKGIIHRDLKPANVLLDTDGHPKVTDFGLAKQIDHKSMLTRTGAVVGTPFYMPPEQARGDVDIDQRADVYALGVILYELLTLKLPFHGETTMEVYHKILEEEPLPPRKHDSRIDKDVNTIVLKAMDKELSRRYQSALELAEDIERYLQGDPIKARPLGPIGRAYKKAKKNMPVVIVAGITIFALSGSLGLIYWRNQKAIADEFTIHKNHEWDTFRTEIDNQCANARSQITSGIARQRDRDPQGALADLEEAERILEDLPLLAEDFTSWNTQDDTSDYLEKKEGEINEIYQSIYLETGKAHALKQTDDGYAKALEYFARGLERAASESEPGALLLFLETGKVQRDQHKFEQALATFADILKKNATHVDGRLEMGRVYGLAGDPLEALKSFTRVIEGDSKAVRAYLLRGQTYYKLGRNDDALRDFSKVLDLEDDLFEGYVWRGRAHQALGHFGEAQEDLTEAIDITPSLPDGYYYRAELHFAQRKHAQAIKDYEVAISRSAQYYRAYLGLGQALEWILDYERASQQYEEILGSDEREARKVAAEAQAGLAQLNLVQADRFECLLEEEERLRQAGATKDGALGPTPALAPLLSGSKTLRRERLAKAKVGFDKALEADPDLLVALHGRARLAILEKDSQFARTKLEHAMKVLANRPSIRFGGGSESTGEAEEDEWEDDEGWEDDEDGESLSVVGDRPLGATHVLLGRAALLDKDTAKAKSAFEEALKVAPSSPGARAGLGHVALANKSRKEAAKQFRATRAAAVVSSDESAYFYGEGSRFHGLATRSKKPEYFKQARQAFARALASDSFHALARLKRARLTAEWGSHDVAVELAREAVKADPFLRDAYELLGFLFTRDLPEASDPKTKRPQNLRDYAQGQKHFDRAIKVAQKPTEAADAHYGRALAILAQASDDDDPRIKEAEKDLKIAIKAIPTDFRKAEPYRINQSIAYLEEFAKVNRRLGDEAAANAALEQVKHVRAQALKAAEQELAEGGALRDRLNYSEAIKHFDRAIELNELYADAYYDRGTCYLKIGNFVPGILDFSRALEINPRIADQVYNKVYQISYVVDLNRVITELNKIVADHPSVSYVVFLRGFFYVAKTEFKQVGKSDLENGIADFNRCLELNPTHVTAFLYRGFLWFKTARTVKTEEERNKLYDRALKDYDKALELDPESGISHYLQALSWSVMSADEGLTPEESAKRKQKSLDQLAESFKCTFKGYERIRNEKGFDHVRDMKEFKELMRGK